MLKQTKICYCFITPKLIPIVKLKEIILFGALCLSKYNSDARS